MIQQSHSWAYSQRNSNSKRYMCHSVHRGTIHNSQTWINLQDTLQLGLQPFMFTNRKTDKGVCVCVCVCVCVHTHMYIHTHTQHIYTHTHTHTHTHIHTMEYYSAIKKNQIMPFAATWMDLEFTKLSEVSQKEKDKYHVISLCMWNLKYDTNELVYKTQTDSQIQKTNLQLPREKDLEEG